MRFVQVTEFYAECQETKYKVIKYLFRGVPNYSAFHPQFGFIQHNCTTAKEAAGVCRAHFEKRGGVNG